MVKKNNDSSTKNLCLDCGWYHEETKQCGIGFKNHVTEKIFNEFKATEPRCKYCKHLSETDHDECINDNETRIINKLCEYCGLNHEKTKTCKTYLNYGLEKIFIQNCVFCSEPVHPNYGTKAGHDVCVKEQKRRKDGNLCDHCEMELVYNHDINWGTHNDCYSKKYVGYAMPDQKMDLKVGYYPKSIFKPIKKNGYSPAKNRSNKKHVSGHSNKEKKIQPANFGAIGGLDAEIEKIREIVELPIFRPELFKNAGITPPKGILLYGPSGTGKTLLAKTMAEQYGMNFTYVSATSLHRSYVGDTERLIREMFKDAVENEPSILFIDEVDSICKDRSDVDRMHQKDTTEQFLASMDNLGDSQVVVVGSTNYPDMLDTAFRRPGRFDVEIEIGLPDAKGRHAILKIHTKQMPLKHVNLKTLAEKTHGFTGADIASLVTAAGMSSIREAVKESKNHEKNIGITLTSTSRMVTSKDFENALKIVKPSILRDTERMISGVGWDDIGGLDSVKTTIMEDVIWPVKYSQECSRMKINASKGILLYGPPGTGKTMVAKAIANGIESNFVTVGCSELISDHPGKTEKNIKNVFENARKTKPCVLFLDEIDSILIKRNSDANNNRIVTQILLELDGIVQSDGVILVGATNMPELIDNAVMRPGRFDKIIEIKPPDNNARESIIKVHVDKRPHNAVDYKYLADITDGFTGADIAHAVNTAASSALRDYINKDTSDVKELKLLQCDIEDAIARMKQKRQVI